MRNTLKAFALTAVVAVSVVFASAALAAEVVELSSTMGMPALKQTIGEPTSMAGYNVSTPCRGFIHAEYIICG